MRTSAALAAVLLALTACSSSGTGPAARATVAGQVLSAPQCPVERIGSPCPPAPVAGAAVVALRSGAEAGATHTDSHGRFTLRLAPGRYLIRATNVGGYTSTAQRRVTLAANATVTLRLVVDSGIR